MNIDLPVESDEEIDVSNPLASLLHIKEKKLARLQVEIAQIRAKMRLGSHNSQADIVD